MPRAADLRSRLIALNADPELARETICRLAASGWEWTEGPAVPQRLERLARTLSVPTAQLHRARLTLSRAGEGAAREVERAAGAGAAIVTALDPGYPPALRDLALPPPVLYVRGPLPANPAVAIVGSRGASPYGREAARLFGRELAALGLAIVSGFARGVDACAHAGALEAEGGLTVAVLGSGLDVDYPRGHRALGERIVAGGGALITEFPFGAEPRALNFPVRNRVIAALTLGVLVVQAAPRSGSLITARCALELGREVWAVPGPIFDPRAAGPNTLIRDGAFPAQHPRDILESLPERVRAQVFPRARREATTTPMPGQLLQGSATEATQLPASSLAAEPDGVPSAHPRAPGTARGSSQLSALGCADDDAGGWQERAAGLAARLLAALVPGDPRPPEQLASEVREPVEAVLAALLELELGGRVERHPGPAYTRTL